VAYRFFLASALLFAWCLARRLPLRLGLRQHGWLALFGVGSLGISYVFVYYAEQHIASGLVAVGFSVSPLLAMLGMRAFFAAPMTGPVALASLLGVAGVALVFYPELARLQSSAATVAGAVYIALALVCTTLGNMVAYRNQRAGMPLWQGMAWAMLYGASSAVAVAVLTGKRPSFELTAAYTVSLVYLAVLGSVVAFASYLTLLKRVGAARAGYIGVMVPVVALFVSAAMESFRFHALTWAGVAVSVAGNVLMLRERA